MQLVRIVLICRAKDFEGCFPTLAKLKPDEMRLAWQDASAKLSEAVTVSDSHREDPRLNISDKRRTLWTTIEPRMAYR